MGHWWCCKPRELGMAGQNKEFPVAKVQLGRLRCYLGKPPLRAGLKGPIKHAGFLSHRAIAHFQLWQQHWNAAGAISKNIRGWNRLTTSWCPAVLTCKKSSRSSCVSEQSGTRLDFEQEVLYPALSTVKFCSSGCQAGCTHCLWFKAHQACQEYISLLLAAGIVFV